MNDNVDYSVKSYAIYMKDIRERLHSNPETAFQEFETQKLITAELDQFGIQYRTVKTGVIADIGCGNNIIAFRCDMDALAITEAGDAPYKSRCEGVMHACGHDGHTAMLLGLAKYLSEHDVNRHVRLIFQPAEEGDGGAMTMVDAGCLDGVSEIYAIHVAPGIPEEVFGICRGANMAGTVEFDINVTGNGAHAAHKQSGIDAVSALVSIIQGLGILEEDVAAEDMLLHVGKIEGGTARNIVASSARLEATFRYFDTDKRDSVMYAISRIVKSCDDACRTKSQVNVKTVYIPVVNHDGALDRIRRSGLDIVEIPRQFTAEDFAFYVNQVPGAIMWLGVGERASGLHTPQFDFDSKCLTAGLDMYLRLLSDRTPL